MEHPSNSSNVLSRPHCPECRVSARNHNSWHTRAEQRDGCNSRQTDEINQQEHHRKTKIYLTVTLQIEPQPECNGNRYPTEIEYPGKEIGNRTMVQSKILTRDKDSTVYRQAKKGFFCLIKSFYINGIHLVIGIYAHPVIRNAEYENGNSATANLRVVCPAKNNTKNTPAIRKCSGRSPIQTAVRIRKNAVMTITSTASLTEGNKLFSFLVFQ